MVNYLSAMKEETPAWLLNHKLGDRIDLADVMQSRSVAYPGSGDDGRAIKLFSRTHAAHVFFYIDPRPPQDTALRGYHLIDRTEYKWRDFGMKAFRFAIEAQFRPNGDGLYEDGGYFALTTLQPWMNEELRKYYLATDNSNNPYLRFGHKYIVKTFSNPWISLESRLGSLLIYERDPDLGEEHGVKRIALFLISDDAIPAYAAIWGSKFCQTGPTFLVVQTDMETCGLFTRNSPLSLVAKATKRFPDYILGREGYNPPEIIWSGYTAVEGLKYRPGKACHGRVWNLFRRSF